MWCGSTTATSASRPRLEGTEYVLADMADDAVAVLDAIGVDKAHVMGCSMGGMIVQRLVARPPCSACSP